jgi:hypothetical protein
MSLEDVNDLPEIQEALRDKRGLEAAGLKQNEAGEFVADGCRVNVYPSCEGYEIDIHLPGGGTLSFDVDRLAAGPPKKGD